MDMKRTVVKSLVEVNCYENGELKTIEFEMLGKNDEKSIERAARKFCRREGKKYLGCRLVKSESKMYGINFVDLIKYGKEI